MTDQPSLFKTAPVQQWVSGFYPHILRYECPECGNREFRVGVPPTFCPKCGTVLTGGYTADEYNRQAKEWWDELHEEREERER